MLSTTLDFVGRSDEASILFNQMQEEGIKPGKVLYLPTFN